MSAWWTYRPSDFLMFAPRIYWRLFESVNLAYWPVHLLIVLLVLASVVGAERRWRRSCGWLAVMFAACAWVFLHQRFAPIFWFAEYVAWAFGAQALLLLHLALAPGRTVGALGALGAVAGATRPSSRVRAAAGMALWTVLLHPLLAPLAGRPWTQTEWPGLAPDPTAILGLAWLLWLPAATGWRGALYGAAWVVPVAWCLISAATLATMGEWQAVVMLAAPAAALVAMRPR